MLWDSERYLEVSRYDMGSNAQFSLLQLYDLPCLTFPQF